MSDTRPEDKPDAPQIDPEAISEYEKYLLLDSIIQIEGTDYSLIKTLDKELHILSCEEKDKLGSGQSSIGIFKGWRIKKGDEKITFEPVAVKIQDAKNSQIFNEQKVAQIFYPKETKPVVIDEKTGNAYLITKRLPNKPLADKKEKVDPDVLKLPTDKKLELIVKILNLVKLIHDQDWTHGDLTGENILLDEKLNPNLSDFGNAQKIGFFSIALSPGSVGHLAFETIIGIPPSDPAKEKIFFFSKGNDIFSIAPVLMSILGAKNPLKFKLAARNSVIQDKKNSAEVVEEFDMTGIENMLKDKDVSMNENARKIFIAAIKEHLESMGNNDYRLRPQSIDHSIKFFEAAKRVLENYQLKKSSFSLLGMFSDQKDDVRLLHLIAEKEPNFTLKT